MARGLYWVAVVELPSPTDELQHFHYVQSMARGDGPPEVGVERLSRDALALEKRSVTRPWRPEAVRATPADPLWGPVRESYEGAQPPLYYALTVPAYGAARPFGAKAALYAVRVMSVVLALLAVPLAYLLTRELFPRLRVAWLAAPALLVMVAGFNANTATVTNDALVVPVSTAALLPVARAMRVGLSARLAVLTGVVVGLALLTKATTAAVVPLVVVGAAVVAWLTGRSVAAWWRFVAVATGLAALVYAPWVVWNLVTYGAPSGSDEMSRILGQPDLGASLTAVRYHLGQAVRGFWDFEVGAPKFSHAMWWWTSLAVVALAAGLLVAWRRRLGQVGAAVAWLASAWPFAFAGMLFVILVLFSGRSSTVGRHLYPALVPAVVVVAAGLTMALGPRRGAAALAIAVVVGLAFERTDVHRYLRVKYAGGIVAGRLIPARADQLGDRVREVRTVSVGDAGCEARAVGIRFAEPAPNRLRAGSKTAMPVAALGGITVYALPRHAPIPTPLVIEPRHRAVVDRTGEPVVRPYCAVDHPVRTRFAQLFHPDHLDLSYATVRAWPAAWLATVASGVTVAGGWALLSSRRRRTRP